MIIIAEPYARYTETLPGSKVESAASHLLLLTERICRKHYAERYDKFGITIETTIEIGSTKTWIRIYALIGILTFYGEIRQSVDYLVQDTKTLIEVIQPNIATNIGLSSGSLERYTRRLGVPGELRRLFQSVASGKISAEEASSRAIALLERGGDADTRTEMPDITVELKREFEAIARFQNGKEPILIIREDVRSIDVPVKERKKLPDEPEMALPPRIPFRRKRGVVANRNPKTGEIELRSI